MRPQYPNAVLKPCKRIIYFGIPIDPLSMAETVVAADKIIQQRIPVQHVCINVAKLVASQKDDQLKKAILSCQLSSADGQGIVWGANFLGACLPERVAGIDLMFNLFSLAQQKGYRVFLLGARSEVLVSVKSYLQKRYPDLIVCGDQHGYFTDDTEAVVVNHIKKSKADILLVAMSTPKKEIFLNKHINELGVPFVMGVGGSFDVVAGVTKRAPMWMQRLGLEWFYRIICEPRRMWKRYLTTNLVFTTMMLVAVFKKTKAVRVEYVQ